jgi:hypothetical protein
MLLLNSAVAFVLAGMLATLCHELAHLVAGLLLGEAGTIYPSAVDSGDQASVRTRVIIALAGPVFSLASGLLIIRTARHWGNGFVRLFWLWFGFLSAQIGCGYLIIAPVAHVGDTGQALALLNAPIAVYVLSFVVGTLGMVWLARQFASRAVAFSSDRTSLRMVGLFAWLIGTGLLLLIDVFTNVALPLDVLPTVLAGTATIGMFTPMLTFFYRRVSVPHEPLTLKAPFAPGILTLLLVLFEIFALSRGITVG